MDVLTQEEIDILLGAISPSPVFEVNSVEDFSKAILEAVAKNSPQNRENLFQGPHISISKNDLDEIYGKLSMEEPEAIAKIGNSELIPVNVCPHCQSYHKDSEITRLYSNAMPDRNFVLQYNKLGKSKIIRKWRTERQTVICPHCNKPFQPTIVFSEDATVYTPSLCKLQVINDLDEWFAGGFTKDQSSCRLFSSQTGTVKVDKSGKTTLYWDIFTNDSVDGLKRAPAHLLTNLVRYTPVDDLQGMFEREKQISVFSDYDFIDYYHPLHYFNRHRMGDLA